ncbi:MAG TPA: DUF3221 domain-containing protein [Pseudogracilibacillus sp.]|nr:DUF3221 domain-containing protein [Pseudogracilibacillus sp.]
MRLLKILSLLFVLMMLVSCSNDSKNKDETESEQVTEELSGYVLQVEEKRFLMIDNEDGEVYEELKDLSMEKILQMDPDTPLIYVNYSDIDSLKKGDQINVEYDGVMTFSIPGQITAAKVTKVE